MPFFRKLIIVLVACAGQATHVFAQEVVGAVGVASAGPIGRAPGHAMRKLVAGGDVYFRDRIVTKAGSSAQIAFLDRSTLNVGENSDLVIDEFVYKPGGAGTMSASLTKGVLRYVGGDISHGGGTTIRTPTVTIGIRGGIGLIASVDSAAALHDFPGAPSDFHGGTVVVNGYGTLTLRNGASETIISRPGFAAFVGSAGETIGSPVRMSAAMAQSLMQKVTTRISQADVKAPAPSKTTALVRSNERASTSTVRTADLTRAISSAVSVPAAVPGINALQITSSFSASSAVAKARSQAARPVQLVQTIETMPQSIVGISGGKIIVNSPPSISAAPVAAAPVSGVSTTALNTFIMQVGAVAQAVVTMQPPPPIGPLPGILPLPGLPALLARPSPPGPPGPPTPPGLLGPPGHPLFGL